MTPALSARGVRHRYGDAVALDGVDLEVRPGECVALLGPNGAGKTTLIGLATGLLVVQVGAVTVSGADPRRAATRRQLGVVHQSIGFPRTLTVGELVRGAAARVGRPAAAAEAVLAEVDLTAQRHRRAATLSGGQRQRVALAIALVGDPALLLLDEPTVGLDVVSRRSFWRILARHRDNGAGLLLTTHVVEEAAAFADRVVVLARGRVVAEDTPTALAARLPDRTITARTARTAVPDRMLWSFPGVVAVTRDADRVRVATPAPEAVLRRWLAADDDLAELRIEGAGLDDALLALTDRTGAEVPA